MTKFYGYKRASTTRQDINRQTKAFNEWERQTNLKIDEVFTDFCSGKTFNRENYQKLKDKIKSRDYLIVKEVDRLGRNWDGIKKEWQELKDNGVNIIIIDVPILSDGLPNEKQPIEGLDLRLIKEQILALMCYSAQKEREKISQRTKEALKAKKQDGVILGRPRNQQTNKENFIKTLEMMINESIGMDKATLRTHYPTSTFKREIKKYYEKYNTKDYKIILEHLKEEQAK